MKHITKYTFKQAIIHQTQGRNESIAKVFQKNKEKASLNYAAIISPFKIKS